MIKEAQNKLQNLETGKSYHIKPVHHQDQDLALYAMPLVAKKLNKNAIHNCWTFTKVRSANNNVFKINSGSFYLTAAHWLQVYDRKGVHVTTSYQNKPRFKWEVERNSENNTYTIKSMAIGATSNPYLDVFNPGGVGPYKPGLIGVEKRFILEECTPIL